MLLLLHRPGDGAVNGSRTSDASDLPDVVILLLIPRGPPPAQLLPLTKKLSSIPRLNPLYFLILTTKSPKPVVLKPLESPATTGVCIIYRFGVAPNIMRFHLVLPNKTTGPSGVIGRVTNTFCFGGVFRAVSLVFFVLGKEE